MPLSIIIIAIIIIGDENDFHHTMLLHTFLYYVFVILFGTPGSRNDMVCI